MYVYAIKNNFYLKIIEQKMLFFNYQNIVMFIMLFFDHILVWKKEYYIVFKSAHNIHICMYNM